jgi:hypothetical protein
MQPILRAVTELFRAARVEFALYPALARQLAYSSRIMGADCCGAEEGVQALTVEDKNGTAPNTTTSSHADFLAKKLPYYNKRIELFEKYWIREIEKVEKAKQTNDKIKIVLPDGSEKEGVKGATTPMEIAKSISSSLAKKVIVAYADGKEWDINRPLLGDCALKLFGADGQEGMDVRRHSNFCSTCHFNLLHPCSGKR